MLPQPIPVERPQKVLPSTTLASHRPVRPPQTHIALYRRIATVFVILTAGLLAFVIYVVFTRATVVVMSSQEETRTEFDAIVSGSPTDGELPGAILEIEKEISREFPTSAGFTTDLPARGKVLIRSTLYRPQTLIATTRLQLPDGRLYRLKEAIVVPANGSVKADAYADVSGKAGEVEQGEFVIPGLNEETRRFFTVTVADPFVGGQQEGRCVTATDAATAMEALKGEEVERLSEELRKKAREAGLGNFGESIGIAVDSSVTEPGVGEPAESFRMTVRLRATGVFYDRERLVKLTAVKLRESAPFDRALLPLVDSNLNVFVSEASAADAQATLKVNAVGASILSPDAPALDPNRLAGISKAAAEDYLRKTPGVSSVSIRIRPFWVGRMPDSAEHIKLEVR